MIERLILFILTVVFGILGYINSDEMVTNSFTVTEKNKEELKLVYEMPNGGHNTYQATEAEFIEAEIGEVFEVMGFSGMFWVFVVLTVICGIVFLLSLGEIGFEILGAIT